MLDEPTPAPSSPPAGGAPASAGSASGFPASSRRRYRPRHDAAVVLAEIRRLQALARARATRLPQPS